MTTSEFDALRRALQDACGVALDDSKQYLIEARLAPVVKRLGLAGISDFAAQLAIRPYGPLRAELVEALVTGESSFFRDHHPWETLAGVVIPRLIARRTSTRELTFWCAAASTGQEPYSLAMLLVDRFPEIVQTWKITILATDVSRSVLERARSGRFSQLEANRGLPAASLVRHFKQDGLHWEISETIRRMVEFREMNLCQPWPALPAFDVVFLRNVMIYFTVDDKKALLRRMTNALRPDGFLFLGAAETTLNLADSFAPQPEFKSGVFRLVGGDA